MSLCISIVRPMAKGLVNEVNEPHLEAPRRSYDCYLLWNGDYLTGSLSGSSPPGELLLAKEMMERTGRDARK